MPQPAIGWRFTAIMPADFGTVPPHYIDKCSLTQTMIEAAGTYNVGGQMYFPKDRNVDAMTMTFYEDLTYTVYKYFQTWRNRVLDNNGNYGLPVNYKRTIQVIMNDYAGSDALTVTYNGCWPTRPADMTPDGETSGRIIATCLFSVDNMTLA